MTNNDDIPNRRNKTKTVMLGPDITKEIRAQLQEQDLSNFLQSIDASEKEKQKEKQSEETSIPRNFFYSNDSNNEDGQDGDSLNKNKDNNNDNNKDNNNEDDYSIFGGENPISQIQKSVFDEDETLTNSVSDKELQIAEIARAKKATEEVASKIIKDLVLDQPESDKSFKDDLIKEIENDAAMFKKFEYENDNNENKEIADIKLDTKADIKIDTEIKKEIANIANSDINSDINNNINNNINNDINNEINNERPNDDLKATRMNLQMIKEASETSRQTTHIYWSELTPLVGFLVSFSKDPNGEFYEIREGKLAITAKPSNVNSLVICDVSISNMHAIMKISQDKITLLDQFSENGTTVKHFNDDNIIELSGESETILDKDIITFGDMVFKVCLI